jgi:hypothetical protein
VAQLGARLDGIEEVVGSNPIGSTKKRIPFTPYRVYILQRKTSGYKQTWALTHRPDKNWFTGL